MNLNIKYLPGSTIYQDDLRIRQFRWFKQAKSQCSSHPPSNRSNFELPKCYNVEIDFNMFPQPKKLKPILQLKEQKIQQQQQKQLQLPLLLKQEKPTLVRRRKSLNLFVI